MALTEHVDAPLRGRVVARLVTEALLPALELAASRYPLTALGPDGRIRISFDEEGESADLVFSRGALSVEGGSCESPDVVISVTSAVEFVSLIRDRKKFTGRIPVSIARSAWRADLLGRLAVILAAAAAAVAGAAGLPVPGSASTGIKIIIEAVMRAAAVVGASDRSVFDVIQGCDGETLNIRVGGGNCGTLMFCEDRVVFDRDARAPATTVLSFHSAGLLGRIVAKKEDVAEAYSAGKIKYSGESYLLVMLVYLLLRCLDYLDFHPWAQD